jgi:L-aspartate semialdehyde sulfurtransferase ferredoxin
MTKKYLIRFDETQVGEPILAECILETKVKMNVLRADADGNMLIRFPKEQEKELIAFLDARGVEYREEKNVVKHDPELCVNCGACIALCPTKAFSFDEKGKLAYDEDKCVLCGMCLDACPRRALSKPEF